MPGNNKIIVLVHYRSQKSQREREREGERKRERKREGERNREREKEREEKRRQSVAKLPGGSSDAKTRGHPRSYSESFRVLYNIFFRTSHRFFSFFLFSYHFRPVWHEPGKPRDDFRLNGGWGKKPRLIFMEFLRDSQTTCWLLGYSERKTEIGGEKRSCASLRPYTPTQEPSTCTNGTTNNK